MSNTESTWAVRNNVMPRIRYSLTTDFDRVGITLDSFDVCNYSPENEGRFGLMISCLKCQQHANVSQGWICSDNFTCCHTVADQIRYPTQSQYTDTGTTSPSAEPITPGAWKSSHWNVKF